MNESFLEPSDMDVLLGREASSWNHGGNQRFRSLVNDKLNEYDKAATRMEKMLIVAGIVTSIQNSGGRFIKRDDDSDRWYEVSRTTAIEKVGHAIRDKKAKERKKLQFHDASRRPEQQQQQSGTKLPSPLYDHIAPPFNSDFNNGNSSRDRVSLQEEHAALRQHKSFPPSRPAPSGLPAVVEMETGATIPRRESRMPHTDFSINPTEEEMDSRRQQVLLQQRTLLREASRTLAEAEAFLVSRNDAQAMETLKRTDIATKALMASIQLTTAASQAGHGLLGPPPPQQPGRAGPTNATTTLHDHARPLYDPDPSAGYGQSLSYNLAHSGYNRGTSSAVTAPRAHSARMASHLHGGAESGTGASVNTVPYTGHTNTNGSYSIDQGRLSSWPPSQQHHKHATGGNGSGVLTGLSPSRLRQQTAANVYHHIGATTNAVTANQVTGTATATIMKGHPSIYQPDRRHPTDMNEPK